MSPIKMPFSENSGRNPRTRSDSIVTFDFEFFRSALDLVVQRSDLENLKFFMWLFGFDFWF